MAYHKSKPYNPNIQIAAMKTRYPQFKAKQKNGLIEFVGILHVKPELPEYTVSITYRGNLSPLVKVLTPALVAEPPHIYPKTRTLCLYHPDIYQWRKERLVAKDIVFWTAAWIYFYEVWLQTGKWFGPEAPHNIAKIQK